MSLFPPEMTAERLSPERCGAWPASEKADIIADGV